MKLQGQASGISILQSSPAGLPMERNPAPRTTIHLYLNQWSSGARIVVIIGPNASGKSDLAVKIAKKNNGEIISADSRQIYKGLDIGTGKINKKERLGVPHHLLDIASPRRRLTVVDFKNLAARTIEDITKRGKTPIIIGGTGFWIDALVYDFELPAVPPNIKLRKKLEKKSPAELLAILKKLDPERAKNIEQKNPRRLIRAIEIAKALGKVPKIKKKSPYKILWLGIKWPKKVLQKRIHKRLLKRVQAGMIKEAQNLKKHGLPWKRFYELGLEYRFLAEYLRGQLNKKEMLFQLEKAIRQYARRQMVWFKRNKEIHWVRKPKETEILLKKFLT